MLYFLRKKYSIIISLFNRDITMHCYTKLSLVIGGLLLSQMSFATPWGYTGATGPDHWATLDPAYQTCANGVHQSPISIPVGDVPTSKTALATIDYHLNTEALKEVHNSESVFPYQVNKQWLVDSNHNTVEVVIKKPSENNYLDWQNKHYHLVQFHFHAPSENQLDGQSFPLELHFVNQATDGSLAVIGVFFKVGAANPAIQKILNQVPESLKGEKEFEQQGMTFPAEKLLPADHHFYVFPGSLTTPGCNETVKWFVMKHPLELSSEQLAQFQAFIGKDGNSRPVQALKDREITLSKECAVASV